MPSDKYIVRFSFFVATLAWLAMSVSDVLIGHGNELQYSRGLDHQLPEVFFVLFCFFSYVFFRYQTSSRERIQIQELLWRMFVTGLAATIIALVLFFFLETELGLKLNGNAIFKTFINHVMIGLSVLFLISAFSVSKRLVLYQKSRTLLFIWRLFEYSLFVGMIISIFSPFRMSGFQLIFAAYLMVLAILLSVNMKWVAYLDSGQKWKSILLILLTLAYLFYFIRANYFNHVSSTLSLDLAEFPPVLAAAFFVSLYLVFSLLVTLFNLPTSSVFEQKLKEAINFSRLAERISGSTPEQVYEILLESSASTVAANAAWLEIKIEDDPEPYLLKHGISEEEIEELKNNFIDGQKVELILNRHVSKSLIPIKNTIKLNHYDYRSLMVCPIIIKDRVVASLFLLKDVTDGFNKEMEDIVVTFINQATVSLENFRLMSDALDNERYREEIKIARRVQRSLLPQYELGKEYFDLASFSKAADQVGGDYYDFHQVDEHRFALIVADVSGKGTSAAFYMAQMKGIFHSLVNIGVTPVDFFDLANDALSRCLDKSTFITASYFLIDTKRRKVEYSRAGHCPTLLYQTKDKKIEFLEDQGIGLGIIRDKNLFKNYISNSTFSYEEGDVMFLYTDGIVEAHNMAKQEFGYDRLKMLVQSYAQFDVMKIQEVVIEGLYAFCDDHPPNDDFTTMVVKFK
ncbi:GAF domain-containing SpoIIE family protein phosphatase [Persicobacter sp. CCB-QB2]|nr:GAF domain-containing SpoIIE family protein phosphatase [Persicobacter sp. CCB-QB2]